MEDINLLILKASEDLGNAIDAIRKARDLLLADARKQRGIGDDSAARVASLCARQVGKAEAEARKALEGLC